MDWKREKKKTKRGVKSENGETRKEEVEIWLTYVKGSVLFAVEGEGHGEGDLLR